MQLPIAIVLISAVFILENAPNEPIDGWPIHVLFVLLASTSIVGFALVGSTVIAFFSGCKALDRAAAERRLRGFHLALWFAVSGGILYGLGWTQIVRFNWQLDRTFLLDELLVFFPVLLPLIVSWVVFFHADRSAYSNCCEGGLLRYLLLNARHQLALVLIPILLVLAASDLADLMAGTGINGTWAVMIYAGVLLSLLVLFPFMLRLVWQTEPLRATTLRERLVRTSQQVDLKFRDLLIWKSDHRIVNAAVAGIAAPFRYIFLSDGLLQCLTLGEIEAVLLHEAAHVRRRHMWWRLLAFLPPLLVWLTCNELVSQPIPIGINVCSTLGVLVYATVALCCVSRHLEFDADLWALQQLDRIESIDASGNLAKPRLVTALEKLAESGGGGRNHKSWFYPSVAQRVDFLERACRDSSVTDRIQQQTNLLCWCLFVKFTAVLTILLIVLWAEF